MFISGINRLTFVRFPARCLSRITIDPQDPYKDASLKEILLTFIKKQDTFNTKQDNFNAKLSVDVRKIEKAVKAISSGFGRGFEGFTQVVLEILLDNEDLDEDKVFRRSVIFPDPYGEVNTKNKEVEIDLFHESPLVIAEVTAYLPSHNVEKVRRFIRTKLFVEKMFHAPCKTYFCAMTIDESIREEVLVLLVNANITPLISPAR